MIIDCHGHYTTAPKALEAWRNRQIAGIADPAKAGTYHAVAAGETSWHGYARFVIDTARALRPNLPLKVHTIDPVPTSAFPTPARRPHNSRLSTKKLQDAFGLHQPHWQTGVRRLLQEIL